VSNADPVSGIGTAAVVITNNTDTTSDDYGDLAISYQLAANTQLSANTPDPDGEPGEGQSTQTINTQLHSADFPFAPGESRTEQVLIMGPSNGFDDSTNLPYG
jgi:hypothetical protein